MFVLLLEDCFSPMGMSNGSVLDTEISSSSSMDAQHSAAYARVTIAGGEGITRRGCWCAKTADTNQFVEIDLRKPRKVTGNSNYKPPRTVRFISKTTVIAKTDQKSTTNECQIRKYYILVQMANLRNDKDFAVTDW